MPVAPTSTSFRPDLPLRYLGGDPSLDLVNTVDWTTRGLENDRLAEYADLARWAQGAKIASPSDAEALRLAAERRPREAEVALEAARRLRWILQRVFSALASGRIDDQALADFNDLLGDSLRRLGIAAMSGRAVRHQRLRWSWRGLGESLESPLWPVVWSAAGLLTSDEAARVRLCDGPNCGWLFVDRSRNRLRRWCDMATCGTQAKSRRRAARSRPLRTSATASG